MQYLVSGKEMKLLDQNTSSKFHVPELVLMEQAAMTFVQKLFFLQKEYHKENIRPFGYGTDPFHVTTCIGICRFIRRDHLQW